MLHILTHFLIDKEYSIFLHYKFQLHAYKFGTFGLTGSMQIYETYTQHFNLSLSLSITVIKQSKVANLHTGNIGWVVF